jgi:4-hydroxyacetophenone monooxygenase
MNEKIASDLLDDFAELEAALEDANIPTLLITLFQLTGNERWLDEYRPTRSRGLEDNDSGGLPDDVQSEIRKAAAKEIWAWKQGRPPAIGHPDPELLIRMMSVCMGEEIPTEYAPMIGADLATMTSGADFPPLGARPPANFKVLVIGAGLSGLCAGVRLKAAGIEFVVVEKSDQVGGTWWHNRYPGCGVDTPSHVYSFSFASHDWKRFFAGRDEIHQYLEDIATDFDIRDRIRLRTEVLGARYDASTQTWIVETDSPDRGLETLRANVVISAVGAFGTPSRPKIDGLDSVSCLSYHTAEWPKEGVDLAGLRVGVIGTGASAMQCVPAIAETAQSITVFQRSAQWAAPCEKYKEEVPPALRRLMKAVPLYRAWYRLRLSWIYSDKTHATLKRDGNWSHPERSLNAKNDGHRESFLRHIESEIGDRRDLLPSVTPAYPPFGKRMLLDNGWFRTLRQANVHLVSDSVTALEGDQVIVSSGERFDIDALVLATGFDVVRFLAPIDIRGRSGQSLREAWDDDDARAYLGTAIPDFPNFFCIYGPNTQPGHGGNFMFIAECQVNYVLEILEQMFISDVSAVEVRRDVFEQHNQRIDDEHQNMVWTHPAVDTYYRNSRGRVVVVSPFRNLDIWMFSRSATLSDYVIDAGPAASSGSVTMEVPRGRPSVAEVAAGESS